MQILKSLVFGERLKIIKICFAILAISFFSHLSNIKLKEKYPAFADCLIAPEKFHERQIFTRVCKVVESSQDFFVIQRHIFRIKVKATDKVRVGDYVSVYGTFDKGGFLKPVKIYIHKYYIFKRVLQYIISIVVAGAILYYLWWAFLRRKYG